MIDCYCDYDPPEFCSEVIRKALKPHRCYECGHEISAGNQYEYVFGKWDGEILYFKTCHRCMDLRQWVQNNVPCFCWSYGNLHSNAREAIEDAAYRAPAETAGLTFGFLRRLLPIKRPERRAA